MIELLKSKKAFLNITEIERHCNIPNSMLRGAMAGTKKLPDVYIESLNRFWEEFTRDTPPLASTPTVANYVQEKSVTKKRGQKKKVDNFDINKRVFDRDKWTFLPNFTATHKSGKKAVWEFDGMRRGKLFVRFI